MNTEYEKVLNVFASYGFRKSSMEELAKAAEVSRQTLYKRFKNKEAVLDWAVNGYTQEARLRVTSVLKNEEMTISECLFNAFSCSIGDAVPLLRESPHGAEIMDLGTESLKRSNPNFHDDFEKEIADFLVDRNVCKTKEIASDITFVLHMASKGLLLKSSTREEFISGLNRVIQTTTKDLI